MRELQQKNTLNELQNHKDTRKKSRYFGNKLRGTKNIPNNQDSFFSHQNSANITFPSAPHRPSMSQRRLDSVLESDNLCPIDIRIDNGIYNDNGRDRNKVGS